MHLLRALFMKLTVLGRNTWGWTMYVPLTCSWGPFEVRKTTS